MAETLELVFAVTVGSPEVSLRSVSPADEDWAALTNDVIYRDRDAIRIFREHEDGTAPAAGTWVFASLENARNFALLEVKLQQRAVDSNFERVLKFQPT